MEIMDMVKMEAEIFKTSVQVSRENIILVLCLFVSFFYFYFIFLFNLQLLVQLIGCRFLHFP